MKYCPSQNTDYFLGVDDINPLEEEILVVLDDAGVDDNDAQRVLEKIKNFIKASEEKKHEITAEEVGRVMLWANVEPTDWREPKDKQYLSRRWCHYIGQDVYGYGSTPYEAAVASMQRWDDERARAGD